MLIVLLLVLAGGAGMTSEKDPVRTGGALRSSVRLRVLNRTTRTKTQSPEWRIFWISARRGSAFGEYRGQRPRCQRSRHRDSRRRNLSMVTLRDPISPKIHHDACTRNPRPLQVLRPPRGRPPRSDGQGGRILFAART